jgi:putative NADH-flavin reductase
MKLVVFGATGGTGRQIVLQALEHGHEVTAIVRNREAVSIDHERLEVIQGDVLSQSSFSPWISGKDAVLSALGVNHRRPTTVYSEGTGNMLKAMQSSGVRRLVCLSSAGLEIPSDTPLMQRIVIRLVIQKMYRHAYEDMSRMEKLVRRSGIDWTVIRPPRLTDGAKTGTYRVAYNQPLSKARGISRGNLADYMIQSISDSASFQTIVDISM